MTTLTLGFDHYTLRDDLDAEDLICLLDLLRDARGSDGRLIDVLVGVTHPRRDPAAPIISEQKGA